MAYPLQGKPPTERQEKVLQVLLASDGYWPGESAALTPNEIGWGCGFHRGQEGNRTTRQGRVMGPAQRVIGTLKGLERRGLIRWVPRPDGLSGSAYRLTEAGAEHARRRNEGGGPGHSAPDPLPERK